LSTVLAKDVFINRPDKGRLRWFGTALMTPFRKGRQLTFLTMLLAAAGTSQAMAQALTGQGFTHEVLQRQAEELAKKAYEPPPVAIPKGAENLDYDQFRQIRFRRERTIWRGEGLKFALQVLPIGWLFKSEVALNIVEGGQTRPLASDNSYFDLGPLSGKLAPEARLGFSGFRLTGPLNRPDLFDEIIVFQGASYFRAVSRGQIYGLSARGLAINIAKPEGEEFPHFRSFWIEKPQPGATYIVVHALLDSPSVAGAYRFQILPGAPTAIEVQATLYPRKEIANAGIAPLTSMFLFSASNRSRMNDFRPAVHDSDGLAVTNGWEEQLWRPLNNPRRLQTSSFLDDSPRAFGLIQRQRTFPAYQDLEARYERRPSGWVETRGQWGPGAVELVEIPSEEEIHDNIVAYWKPAGRLVPGKSYAFNYRLVWPDDVPWQWPTASVVATRSGLIAGPQRKAGVVQFVVDFKPSTGEWTAELPAARLEASAGAVSTPVVQANPEIDGLRVSFSFDAKGATSSEFRLVLVTNEKPVSETWLYRWTKD
jgi:glucans biosynthesis protein